MATYDKRRFVGALLLIFLVLAGANWYFEFVFPSFARAIVALGVLMALVYVTRYAPRQ